MSHIRLLSAVLGVHRGLQSSLAALIYRGCKADSAWRLLLLRNSLQCRFDIDIDDLWLFCQRVILLNYRHGNDALGHSSLLSRRILRGKHSGWCIKYPTAATMMLRIDLRHLYSDVLTWLIQLGREDVKILRWAVAHVFVELLVLPLD